MNAVDKKRKLLLGGALIATLIAVVLAPEEDKESVIETVEPIQTTKSSGEKIKAQESNSEHLDVSQLGPRKFNPSAGELFVSTTWAPKRPKISPEEQEAAQAAQIAKASAPPPAPTAPPLPFKYAGKAIADNETWVFLSQAGENFIAKIGGKIDGKYRLDSINDNTITMTYLPLSIKQTLTIDNKIAGNFQ